MVEINIDKEKCINCSICSQVCAFGVLERSPEDGSVSTTPKRKSRCAACGQCEAHCPKGAINIEYPSGKTYQGNKPEQIVTSEQMGYHMASRRSVRNFKNKPVDRKQLEELLEIVRFAPTGRNRQHVGWVVIHSTDKLKGILEKTIEIAKKKKESMPKGIEALYLLSAIRAWEQGKDMIFRDAPHLIAAYAPPEGSSAQTDAIVALTYFELAAPTFGIGTCWAGIFRSIVSESEELRKELEIPDDNNVYGALMFGYPKFESHRIPKRNPLNIKWI